MGRAVGEDGPDVDHRVAGEHAGRRALDWMPWSTAGMNSRGMRAAGDLVDELVAAAGARGLEVDDDVGELARATGLLDVAVDDLLGRRRDRLAVGDLGLADGGVDLELAQHAVDDDLEVQLALAGDDGLAGLLVGADLEGRVLLGQGLQRLGQLVLVGLGLGLDGHVDDRLGEVDRLEDDRRLRSSQSVSPVVVPLRPMAATMSPAKTALDVLAVVGVHLEHAADPLLAVLRRVVDVGAGLERAGVDPEVGELADVGVAHDLEGQGRERLAVVGRPLELLDALRRPCP